MTIRAGDQSPDVETVQRILQEGGYYDGPIDGTYGPDTEAAVRAYQTAHGLEVDGVVGPHTWGNMHGDPQYPNNTTGALGGGGSTVGGGDNAHLVPAAKGTDDSVRKKYPYLAFLLDDPDPKVRELLLRADRENMTAAAVQAELMQTDWWKRTSESQRTFYGLQAGDPATFKLRVEEVKSRVRETGAAMGYDESVLDEGYLNHFARKAFEFGMTERQIQAMIADEITPLIGASEKSNTLRDIRTVMQDYHYVIDNPSMLYWAREINSGRQTIDNFRNTVVQQMRGLFPHLANLYDQGMTQRQILAPYKEMLSKEFDGKSGEDFDFGEAKWRHVIDYVDEKTGVHRTMSMMELQKYARTQPEWRNTKNAKDQVAQLGEQLLESFGALG